MALSLSISVISMVWRDGCYHEGRAMVHPELTSLKEKFTNFKMTNLTQLFFQNSPNGINFRFSTWIHRPAHQSSAIQDNGKILKYDIAQQKNKIKPRLLTWVKTDKGLASSGGSSSTSIPLALRASTTPACCWRQRSRSIDLLLSFWKQFVKGHNMIAVARQLIPFNHCMKSKQRHRCFMFSK